MGLKKWLGWDDISLIDASMIESAKKTAEEEVASARQTTMQPPTIERHPRMIPDYDFSDPKIQRMLDRHEPREQEVSYSGCVVSVACDVCFGSWPCPSIQALRKWNQERPHGKPYIDVEPAQTKERKS